jgi:hypothetical protein
MAPLQRFENACIQLLTQRGVDVAVGAQLDVLGRIVGQPRSGLMDDVYRRYIRARIATNRATGKREELINIANLILNNTATGVVLIHTEAGATLILETRIPVDLDTMAVLVNMLGSAVAVGVRIIVSTSQQDISNTFRFDVGPGFDVGHLNAGADNATS